MNSAESIEFDPSYVAGLLDGVGRGRFDISDAPDGRYTVRPMLRLRPDDTDLRAAVVGEFLEQRGYQYDYVERAYGDEFFRLQQRSDLQDLETYLEGESAHLVRELSFVNGLFADEFDFEILEPRELLRFTLARDALRHGWRPKGRYHVTPAEIAEEHDLDRSTVDVPALPAGVLRSDYAIEWIAGVYDAGCRYRPSIAESPEHEISYAMYPVARLHRAGVDSQMVSNFLRFCDDYDLSVGDSTDQNSLRVVFTGASNIRRILDVVFPRLLVLAEASDVLVNAILPRFDEDDHRSKQGFYELLRDFDQVATATGGPFRHRQYDPAYFADLWRDELELVEPDVEPAPSAPSESVTSDLPEEVTIPRRRFAGESGRYRSLVEWETSDPELATELRSLYDDRCQICGARLASSDGTGYSEIHHLQPLAEPHGGPDAHGNMIVLCPNHHADFDNGVIRVDSEDRSIEHPYDSAVDGGTVTVDAEHELSDDHLRYHGEHLCRLR